jgi:hypothetical protein
MKIITYDEIIENEKPCKIRQSTMIRNGQDALQIKKHISRLPCPALCVTLCKYDNKRCEWLYC